MNSRNYSYIRTVLNGSIITDEILNRVFCLSKEEVTAKGITDWCQLGDDMFKPIVKWIASTTSRVRYEKLKYKMRARYWANVNARKGYEKAIQS